MGNNEKKDSKLDEQSATKTEKIGEAINAKGIRVRLMKIGSMLNSMDEIFSRSIKDYSSLPIESHTQMDLKITNLLVEDLKNIELDVVDTP